MTNTTQTCDSESGCFGGFSGPPCLLIDRFDSTVNRADGTARVCYCMGDVPE